MSWKKVLIFTIHRMTQSMNNYSDTFSVFKITSTIAIMSTFATIYDAINPHSQSSLNSRSSSLEPISLDAILISIKINNGVHA